MNWCAGNDLLGLLLVHGIDSPLLTNNIYFFILWIFKYLLQVILREVGGTPHEESLQWQIVC